MKKGIVLTLLVLATGFSAWWWLARAEPVAASPYQTATVERGDLESVVSATGTLAAVETVEVGTQISGTLGRVLVDFNDRVEKGQLLAVIETDLLDASVRDAEAELARARAELEQQRAEVARSRALFADGILSQQELQVQETQAVSRQAAVVSAEAVLQRARTNRGYAEIRSPIDGVVIERTVDRGQTVAASLSAPILFLIAEDLGRMEILADVDESDIGQIREGQPVRFTVAAYPDELFTGAVRQIRLQPQVIQDVVNYTVVVQAANDRALLLPGMTATVDFVVERAEDVLKVSAAALRFQPTDEMTEAVRARWQSRTAAEGGAGQTGQQEAARQEADQQGAGRSGAGVAAVGGGGLGDLSGGESVARLWYLDDEGKPAVTLVRTGAGDGLMTQVTAVRGRLEEGMEVITKAEETPAQGRSTNPFSPFSGSPRGLRRLGA